MWLVGCVFACVGNCAIGVGQALQKHALNTTTTTTTTNTTTTTYNSSASTSTTSNTLYGRARAALGGRVASGRWLAGVGLTYAGEVGGNFVAMALAPASVVVPFGIVSVVVSVLIGHRFLNEPASPLATPALRRILIGVLIVLLVAPKPNTDIHMNDTNANTNSDIDYANVVGVRLFCFLVAWLPSVALVARRIYLTATTSINNNSTSTATHSIYLLALAAAWSGNATVLASKLLASSLSSSTTSSLTIPLLLFPLLLIWLILAALLQESIKQLAFQRHNVSQFLPIYYAALNLSSAVVSAWVFHELSSTQHWIVFLVGLCTGLACIVSGARMLMVVAPDTLLPTAAKQRE